MRLVRPSAMPEEPIIALRARAARWNGVSNESRWISEMRGALSAVGANVSGTVDVEVIASFHGEPIERFVQSHTMIPLLHAFSADGGDGMHGGAGRRHLLQRNAFRFLRSEVFLCEQCVGEDLDFHGYAWWRRDHQLPGAYWCLKHQCALHAHSDRKAFAVSPELAIKEAKKVDAAWCATIRDNEIINRFVSIQESLLSVERPMREKSISGLMRDIANAKGFHAGKLGVTRPLVSAYLRDRVHGVWLEALFPGVGSADTGYFFPIDGALRGDRASAGAISYALVAATLWESADAAVGDMLEASSLDRRVRPKIEAAYVKSGGCCALAAPMLDMPSELVQRSFLQAGLPPLDVASGTLLVEAAAAFFVQNLSLRQAASSVGVKQADLEDLVRVAGGRFSALLKEGLLTATTISVAEPRSTT